MGKAIRSSQVDEDAKAADAADPAFADLTLVQLFQEAVLLDGAPVLDRRALG